MAALPCCCCGSNVLELLLRADARQLHAACAKSLEGAVDVLQLAQHSEQAGLLLGASRLYYAHALALQLESESHSTIAASGKKSLACARRVAETSEQSERLEVSAILLLFSTWTLSSEELDQWLARCDWPLLIGRSCCGQPAPVLTGARCYRAA